MKHSGLRKLERIYLFISYYNQGLISENILSCMLENEIASNQEFDNSLEALKENFINV